MAALGAILMMSVVTACGGGGESETLEINSGAPSHLPGLEAAFEHKVRKSLVSVSTGDYTVLECRRGPREKYSQTPRGICKRIH